MDSSFVLRSFPSAPSRSFLDLSVLRNQQTLPVQFVWTETELAREELDAPVVDLAGFLNGNDRDTQRAAAAIRVACSTDGFFYVVNHGVGQGLARKALEVMDGFFALPLQQKLAVKKSPGCMSGYSGAHADRFASRLPWKETLSLGFECGPEPVILDYVRSALGHDEFEELGKVYQEYCEAMNGLALAVMELVAVGLGVDRLHFRRFFQDGSAILRCNYYPPCMQPDLTLGTGPHCDPTALTLLIQDQIPGLQVFSGGSWKAVQPIPGAIGVNVGDCLMALTNGECKSCLHRAVVNGNQIRKSVAFFLCSRKDKVIRPPEQLACGAAGSLDRKYPDFRWSDLLSFTQNHYRSDASTLERFTQWFTSQKHI